MLRTDHPPRHHLYPFHHVEIDDTVHGVYSDWRAIVAELLGTLLFVFVSSGVAVATNTFGPDDQSSFHRSVLPMALANGLAFTALVFTFYHLSGSHLNPAITWGAIITRRIGIIRGFAYIIAQVVGAVLGALLVSAATPAVYHGRLGAHFWDETLSNFNGFLLEMMLTFILVFVVFSTLFDPAGLGRHAAIAIGFTVTVGYLVGWVFVGPAMNPARALGTAVVYGSYDHMWIYWLAPMAGSTLAALLYTLLFLTRPMAIQTTDDIMATTYKHPSHSAVPIVPTETSRLIPGGPASV